jgi:purine-nucleoside phosphorylase
MGIRILGMLGVKRVVLTNASGAINPDFSVGNIMVLSDQINMTGENPLRGTNIEDWGPRFPDMSAVYDPSLQTAALEAGTSCGLRLEQGTYVGVLGPSLETPAETRAFRLMGGDAVGMSTVVEAIAARHMGLEVLGLSCLTNRNIPGCMEETSFEAIVEQAERTAGDLGRLLEALIPKLE